MAALAAALSAKAEAVRDACRAAGLTLATAESCTGGLVSAALTAIPGSSAWFDCGVVTYSNAAKSRLLDVPAALIAEHGAVSEAVARAMAEGVLAHSPAQLGVAITGIAGPGGGSDDKPVGLVHFATARRGYPTRHERRLFGPDSRDGIRQQAALQAMEMLIQAAAGGLTG